MSSSRKTPVEIVKEVAEGYREIFHTFLRHTPPSPIRLLTPTISAIDVWVHAETNETRTVTEKVYWVHQDEADAPVGTCARDAFPPDTPEHLMMGFLKWNHCDFAVETFLHPLQTQLELRLPGTKVEWFRANLRPVHIFRYVDQDVASVDPLHSSLLVTLPTSADQFVIDFTIEQYGFWEESWFMTLDAYRALLLEDIWVISEFEKARVDPSLLPPGYVRSQEFMRKLCEELNPGATEQMTRTERLQFISSAAHRRLYEEGFQGDGVTFPEPEKEEPKKKKPRQRAYA